MEPAAPGTYWKTPFIWESGSAPLPARSTRLRFSPAELAWLRSAIASAMASSLDESDRFTVAQIGLAPAVQEVCDVASLYFHTPAGWWITAADAANNRVGFVLIGLFRDLARWKGDRPQGSIVYMGVLPEYRGNGYSLDLVSEATHLCAEAHCWRVFCDTGSSNAPMISAFRQAGYEERKPWQRPLH